MRNLDVAALREAGWKTVRNLFRSDMPPLVFHYTSIAGFRGIIESNTIWCSDVTYANDPTEITYGRNVVRTGIELSRHWRALLGRFDATRVAYYVASFSSAVDSLPQWRAYCRGGKGLAVGFDTTRFGSRAATLEVVFAHVEYDKVRQEIAVAALLDLYADWLAPRRDAKTRSRAEADLLSLLVTLCGMFKDPAYAPEQEFRLIVASPPDLANTGYGIEFRATDDALIPYVPMSLKSPGVTLPITHVIVGPCLPPQSLETIHVFLQSRNRSGIEVHASAVRMRPG